MDERFCVPDFDLEDDDYVAGECFECHGFSRLLDVDMLCPKCRPTPPAPDAGDSAPSQTLSTPDMFSAIEHEPTPAPAGKAYRSTARR